MASGGSAPAVPDYVGAATAAGKQSQNLAAGQTVANRPDIVTPWGTMHWTRTPGSQPRTGDALPHDATTFNEQAYLAANPDVAAVVAENIRKAGGEEAYNKWKDFSAEGHWKRMDPLDLFGSDNDSFDPNKEWMSGWDHYNALGKTENRSGIDWKDPDYDPNVLHGDDKWSMSINLTPEQQSALNSQQGIQQMRSMMGLSLMGNMMGSSGLDFSSLSPGGQPINLQNFGFGPNGQLNYQVPKTSTARQALAAGGDVTADQIRKYASDHGWVKDGAFDTSHAGDLYSAAQAAGISGRQLDEAGGWASGTADNWVKSSGKDALSTASDVTAQQIRDYVQDKGWYGMDGTVSKDHYGDIYDAAIKNKISGSQLDAAFHLDPGASANWVKDNPLTTGGETLSFGGGGGSGFNFDLSKYLSGGSLDSARQSAEDRITRFQAPIHQRETDQLEAKLANMGIQRGSEAWKNDLSDLHDRQARDSLQAVQAGQNESALDFGQALSSAQFGNSALQAALGMQIGAGNYNQGLQNQQLQNLMTQQFAPINYMNAFLNGSQVQMPNFPGFTGANAGQTTDLMGALSQTYGGQMNAYNANVANANATNQAGAGLASAALMAAMMYSDRRLKKDIVHVGTVRGVNVYEYEYVWGGGRTLGVMAQEVPWAAVPDQHGFLMVDYSKVWA